MTRSVLAICVCVSSIACFKIAPEETATDVVASFTPPEVPREKPSAMDPALPAEPKDASVCACETWERCVDGRCREDVVAYVHVNDGLFGSTVCFDRGAPQERAPVSEDGACSLDPANRRWLNGDVGLVTVEGENGIRNQLVRAPDGEGDRWGGCYILEGDVRSRFKASERVRITASGGADVAAFATEIRVPAALDTTMPRTAFDRNAPLRITWTPATTADLEIRLSDYKTVVRCAPPNDGQFLVPVTVTQRFDVYRPWGTLNAHARTRLEAKDRGIVMVVANLEMILPIL